MPLALAFFGILFLVAGVRDKQDDLFQLLEGDFTGPHNFLYWIVAILAVGLIGYVPRVKPLSTAFMVLLLVVMFLANGAFFQKFQEAIESTSKTPPPTVNPNASSLGELFPGLDKFKVQF